MDDGAAKVDLRCFHFKSPGRADAGRRAPALARAPPPVTGRAIPTYAGNVEVTAPKVRFAIDSPLEGGGFEPSVPGREIKP